MTTQKEIQILLKKRAASIAEERIVPEALDLIAEWTGELMSKLTTLGTEHQSKIDYAFDEIYEALIKETAAQLIATRRLYGTHGKKLSDKK